jgi:hypothetical protein
VLFPPPGLPGATQAQRRQGRKSGGRGRGAAGEMSEAKRQIRGVIGGVLRGNLARGVGAVLFQGYNTLLKAVEVERKIREQGELEERLAALEQAQNGQEGSERWGA